MSKLGVKKLLVVIIATILTLGSGITLAAAIYNTRADNAPRALDVQTLGEGADDWNFDNILRNYKNCSTFEITHKDGLIALRKMVNEDHKNNENNVYDFSGKRVKLCADIDLSGENWEPIGYGIRTEKTCTFRGSFNGQYHTISNLYIDNSKLEKVGTEKLSDGQLKKKSMEQLGLFGYVSNGAIYDLRLDKVNIKVSCYFDANQASFEDQVSVGCLAGKVFNTSIANCVVINGSITNEAKCDNGYAVTGGLVGTLSGDRDKDSTFNGTSAKYDITNCSVQCNIDALNAYTNTASSYGSLYNFDHLWFEGRWRHAVPGGGFIDPNPGWPVSLSTYANITDELETSNYPIIGKYFQFVYSSGIVGFCGASSCAVDYDTNNELFDIRLNIESCYYEGNLKGHTQGLTADICIYNLHAPYAKKVPARYEFDNCIVKEGGSFSGNTASPLDTDYPGENGTLPHEWSGVVKQATHLPSNLPTEYSKADEKLAEFRKIWNKSKTRNGNVYYEVVNTLNNRIVDTDAFVGDGTQFYLPRTNQFNNGVPLSIYYLYEQNEIGQYVPKQNNAIQSKALQVDIKGKGEVELKNIFDYQGKPYTQVLTETKESALYLPYDPTGCNYAEDFNKDSWNPSGDSSLLYGFTITATPNTAEGYELEYMKLVTNNSDGKGTAGSPYKLEVKFVTLDNRERDIKVYFGGYLMVDGTYESAQFTNSDGVTAIRGYAIGAEVSSSVDEDSDTRHIFNEYTFNGNQINEKSNYNFEVFTKASSINVYPSTSLRVNFFTKSGSESWDSIRLIADYSGHTNLNLPLAYTTVESKYDVARDIIDNGKDYNNAEHTPNNSKYGYEDRRGLTDGPMTALIGSTNHGYDELVYVWAVIETQNVTVNTVSKGSNQLNRKVAVIEDNNFNTLNIETLNFNILKNIAPAEDVKTGKFKNEQGLVNRTYFYKDKISILDKYETQFTEQYLKFGKGELTLSPKPIAPAVRTEEYYLYNINPSVRSSSIKYNFFSAKGYSKENCEISMVKKDAQLDITLKFIPIEYSFYVYAIGNDNQILTSDKLIYTVEKPFNVYTDVTFNGRRIKPEYCGIIDDADVWSAYGYMVRYPKVTQDEKIATYSVGTSQTYNENSPGITFGVEKDYLGGIDYQLVLREIEISGKKYKYAKIANNISETGGGGIWQSVAGNVFGEVYSDVSIMQMGPDSNQAHTNIPCILILDDYSSINVKIKNVKYSFQDNDLTKYQEKYLTTENQYHYKQNDNDMGDLYYNNAGNGYVYEFSLGNTSYAYRYLRYDKREGFIFYIVNFGDSYATKSLAFFPYVYSKPGELLYYDSSREFALYDEYYTTSVFYSVYDNGRLEKTDILNGYPYLRFESGKTYEFWYEVTFKRIELDFEGFLLAKNSTSRANKADVLNISYSLNSIDEPENLTVFWGANLKCDGPEYVGEETDENKFYRFKITMPDIYLKFGYKANEINYEIIYSKYFTTAEKVNADPNYKQIYVIFKGGHDLLRYSGDLLSVATARSDYLLRSSSTSRFSSTDINFNYVSKYPYNDPSSVSIIIKAIVGEIDNSIPLYYEQGSEDYSNYTLPFVVSKNYDLQDIISSEKDFSWTNTSMAYWGLTSNKSVLLKSGFTHIATNVGDNSLNLRAINAMSQTELDGIFENALGKNEGQRVVVLLRNYSPVLNFTNPLDYERWFFEIGESVGNSYSVDSDVVYYKVFSLKTNSFGSLQEGFVATNLDGQEFLTKNPLKIKEDDPYLKLLFATYELQINVGEFLYNGNEYVISNLANQNRQFEVKSINGNMAYQLADDTWLKFVQEDNVIKPYLIVSKITWKQVLKFDISTGILSLSDGANNFELLVYVPINNADGYLSYNADNQDLIGLYYESPQFKLTDGLGNPIQVESNLLTALNIDFGAQDASASNVRQLTIQLKPKQYSQNFDTFGNGIFGENQYTADGVANSLGLKVFAGTNLKVGVDTSVAQLQNSDQTDSLTYYSISFILPTHLEAIYTVERDLSNTIIYIIPRLMAKTGHANFYVYPVHGYMLENSSLQDGTPIIVYELEDYSGPETALTATSADASVQILKNAYYKICYKMLDYYIPLYYRGVGEEVSDFYKYTENIDENRYNVTESTTFPAVTDILGDEFSDLSGGFDWALTSNKTVLMEQGFNFVLKPGEDEGVDEILSLDTIQQDNLDAIFDKARLGSSHVELYRSIYPLLAGVEGDYSYDYQKIIFVLTGATAFDRTYAKYYLVSGIDVGSYLGDLEPKELNATIDELENYPYLYPVYKQYELRLFTDVFNNDLLKENQKVIVTTNNQYYNVDNELSPWIGYDTENKAEVIYEHRDVVVGQTLSFDGTNLMLDRIISSGFTFQVAVPLDAVLGGTATDRNDGSGYIYLSNPSLKTYYSKLTWIINENDTEVLTREFDLDTATDLNFSYQIQGETTVRLLLTPREITEILQAGEKTEDSYKTGVGGRIISSQTVSSDSPNRLQNLIDNTVNLNEFTVFAGSSLNLIKAKTNFDYYSINVTAPLYLKDLVEALKGVANREIKFDILQYLSTTTSAVSDYTIYPMHGYKLDVENLSPLKYSDGRELNVDLLTNASVGSMILSSTLNYFVCYSLVDSTIPLYYYSEAIDNKNYTSLTVDFNINSPNIDLSGVKPDGVDVNGWIISTNVNDLTNQFTHILNKENQIERIETQQQILDIFADSQTVTLFRDNGMSDKYDYDSWTFEIGESLRTKTATYFIVKNFVTLSTSYGTIPFMLISADSDSTVGPYIRPMVLKEYSVTIDNLSYDSETMQDTTIHAKDANNLSTYLGVGGEGKFVVNPNLIQNQFGKGYTLSTLIKNTSNYNYQFFNSFISKPSSFFLKQDFLSNLDTTSQCDGNYWFVFNYGYQISGWKVMYLLDNKVYDLYILGDSWQEKEHTVGGIENSISDLNYIYLASLAGYLDSNCFDSARPAELILIPCWQAVKIAPIYMSGTNLSSISFNYGDNYNLSKYESRYTPLGQTLMFFAAPSYVENETKGIILNPNTSSGTVETIAWNYRNLTYTDYSYSNGEFKINLAPKFANNIHKIDLQINEIKPLSENGKNKYVLNSKNYSFDPTNKFVLTEYTYSNKDLYKDADFSFTSLADYKKAGEYLWAENYAKVLNDFNLKYSQAIAVSSLSIFNKIYYTGSSITVGNTEYEGQSYPSIECAPSALKSMYIYLANNQKTGLMPAFLTKYYELVLWHNQGITTTGNPVDYAYATDLYNQNEHKDEITENNFVLYDIWRYSQTLNNGVYDYSLKPHYFRKYYYLNVKTILDETKQVGEYGYLIVSAKDNLDNGNKSENFLAIYLDGSMKFFSFAAGNDWSGLLSHTNVSAENATTELIKDLTPVDKIKIYAGCDLCLSVYDQSKDPTAMASGHYDEMIGYKWTSLIWYDRDGHENFTSNPNKSYENDISKESIDEFALSTAEVCDIDVEFGKIEYSFDIVLVDRNAGSFSYVDNENNSKIGYKILEDLQIKVGEINIISYSATLGYEFAENAFVLIKNGQETVLATYSSLKQGNQINQSLQINLTGEWLRKNLYANYTDYSLSITYLGEIDINTTKIMFNLYARTFDSSQLATTKLEDILLTENWIVGTDVSLEDSRLFAPIESGGYGYVFDGKQYVVIKSYSYVAKNPLNDSNALDQYDFILSEIPTARYNITEFLSDNLGISTGTIAANRNVYIVVEVRPLLYVDVEFIMADYDTNTTVRQITIQNQNTDKLNALSLTLTRNNGYVEQYGVNYFQVQGNTRLYTFFNQENVIPSEKLIYNANRYSGVDYKLNTLNLNENKFTITENSILQITFIPKLLSLNAEYQLDGSATDLQTLKDKLIVENAEIGPQENLHIGSVVNLTISVQSDYLVSITRFGNVIAVIGNSISFFVSDSDYDYGAVNCTINVYKKPNRNIIVRLQLLDSNQQTAADNYGSLTIIVDGVPNENATEANVVRGKRVDVTMQLNTGYSYAGQINAHGIRKTVPLSNGLINLIESFRVEQQGDVEVFPDAGEYLIYIKKELITLELNYNSNEGRYTMFNNSYNCIKSETNGGQTVKITGAYVGSEISFGTVREVANYDLDYFYYIDSSNVKHQIDNNLTVTSELLNACTTANNFYINFGVQTKQKYQVNLKVTASVVGLENNLQYFTNLQEFVSGKYYPSNTNVEFTFFGSVLNKYDVTVTINDQEFKPNEQGYTICSFELKEDTTIVANIEQSKFNLNANEYHYNQLKDLNDPDLKPVDESENLNNLPNISRYNDLVTLNIALEESNYKLKLVEIIFDDYNSLSIEIVDGAMVVKLNGQLIIPDENGIYNIMLGQVGYSYSLTLSNDNLTIMFAANQDLAFNLHYINIKEILPKQ